MNFIGRANALPLKENIKMTTKFDRISIASLKIVASRSEETVCFTGVLKFDGKAIADLDNDGRGGCTSIRARKGCDDLLKSAKEWAKSLPAEKSSHPEIGDLPMDLEFAVSILVSEMDIARMYAADFKKTAKKGGFIREGRIYTLKGIDFSKIDEAAKARLIASMHDKYENIEILAEMSAEDGLKKFISIMSK